MSPDHTAAHQLRATGAPPWLVAEHELEISSQLVEDFDTKMLTVGRHLFAAGAGDEWVTIFRLVYPHAQSTDPIEFLQTGGQFA